MLLDRLKKSCLLGRYLSLIKLMSQKLLISEICELFTLRYLGFYIDPYSFLKQIECTSHDKDLSFLIESIWPNVIQIIEDQGISNDNLIKAIASSWKKIHSKHWNTIETIWRDFYCFCSILLASNSIVENFKKISQLEVMKQLDTAHIVSPPIWHLHVQKLVKIVSAQISDTSDLSKKLFLSFQISDTIPKIKHPIPSFSIPSLTKFYKNALVNQQPYLITDSLTSWPCISDPDHDWRNMNYLKKIAGKRYFPIEIGNSYSDESWNQEFWTLENFIDAAILNKYNQTAYLAQTNLFQQVPEMMDDILIPDYCQLDDKIDITDEPILHAWFGPEATISPCHQDPYSNLLCQVFGSKYIRVYNPSQTENLYPFKITSLENTSQIDIESPDLKQFPLFENTQYLECILNRGDMLYIPPKWWHYVRSLETSFSVSFWW